MSHHFSCLKWRDESALVLSIYGKNHLWKEAPSKVCREVGWIVFQKILSLSPLAAQWAYMTGTEQTPIHQKSKISHEWVISPRRRNRKFCHKFCWVYQKETREENSLDASDFKPTSGYVPQRSQLPSSDVWGKQFLADARWIAMPFYKALGRSYLESSVQAWGLATVKSLERGLLTASDKEEESTR